MRRNLINLIDKLAEIKIDAKNVLKNLKVPKTKYRNLHLGCGGVHLDGFVNIDLKKSVATDKVMNVIDLDYPSKSIERIESYHLIEHLEPREFDLALKEWYRILKPGGVLVIECPDIEKVCKRFLKESDEWKWGIGLMCFYGLSDIDAEKGQLHKNGFTGKRLTRMLKEKGFKEIVVTTPHQNKEMPFLRVEAFKCVG